MTSSACNVVLHLRIRAKEGYRERLLEFLQNARPYYESPGSIRMRVLQDQSDRNVFIEVFEYATLTAYETDQQRVRNDPAMKQMLATWRSLLDRPPVVEVYSEQVIAQASPS